MSRSTCSTADARFGADLRAAASSRTKAGGGSRRSRATGGQARSSRLGALSATARWIFVPQLPHVARPPVLREDVERFRAQVDVGLAEALGRLAQEERAQVRDLLAALAQRRHVDADDAQPVVQILAELAFGDALLEVGVGGGEHPHVDALRPRLADRHDLVLLEEAQQLRLDVERQVADFVEEQRAARPPMRIRPGWSDTAPVKLPRRWPNSWLSARSRPVVVQL